MGFFKKKYILTSAAFFAVSSVLCAKNFSFNLIPYFAVETSVIEEAYYYEDYSKYADEMCSLLEWEQKPSYIFGVEGIFNLNKFIFSLDFSAKLPVRSGSMMDSDYWTDGMKFNYSINENYLDKGFSAKTGFAYNFDFSVFSFKPLIQFSYSFISFNAKNGYGWYGGSEHSSDGNVHSWDSPYAHYYPDGKYHLAGVDYENQTFSILTGFDFSKILFKKWRTGIGFLIAPFTYAYAKDHHLGKSSNFYSEDFVYIWFKNFQFSLKNDFIISERFSVNSVVEGNFILLTKGKNHRNGELNQQQGGFSYKGFKATVGFCVSF